MGDEAAMSATIDRRMLLSMRPTDRLSFKQMTYDIVVCMYYTGLDPFTGQKVYVAQSPGPQGSAGGASVL
jgi:hypothetical protein